MAYYKKEQEQAAVLLNEPIIASVLVSPMNTTKSFTRQLAGGVIGGGIVGGVIDAAIDAAGRKKQPPPPVRLLPQMLLTVGTTQVALFEWKQGFFKSSLGVVLFRAPKRDVVRFETGLKTKTFIAHGILLETTNGTRIELEAHRSLKKLYLAVQEALRR